jgi:hypothetical protein
MKKIISSLLVCVILVGSLLVLASCGFAFGGPSGVYKTSGGTTSMEFKGKEVTIVWSIGPLSYTSHATFEISEEDGEKFITFSYGENEKENSDFSGKMAFTSGTENDKQYIKIGKGILSTTLYKE